jgi:hypothetical protein
LGARRTIATGVVICGDSNATSPFFLNTATSPAGNDIELFGDQMARLYTFAATIVIDALWTNHALITLTGDASITVGTNANWKGYYGKKLSVSLTQDATGGRTATFNSDFQTNWTPDTSANKTNTREAL